MRRIRIQRPQLRRDRPWQEVLPLDPRDPEIRRAKASGRCANPGGGDEEVMLPKLPEAIA